MLIPGGIRLTVLAAFASVGLAAVSSGARAADKRFAVVSDAIERSTFAEQGENIAHFSTDGKFFFVITTRGLLKSDERQASIWLFRSDLVAGVLAHTDGSAVQPRLLASLKTQSNGDIITDARWEKDGMRIAFLGRSASHERHLYVIDIADGRLHQLSPDGNDVTGFDCGHDTYVFTTVPAVSQDQLYQSAGPSLPDAQAGAGASLFGFLYPQWEKETFGGAGEQVWLLRNQQPYRLLAKATQSPVVLHRQSYNAVFSLSPEGHFLLVTSAVLHIPNTWESYATGCCHLEIVADKSGVVSVLDRNRVLQYFLIDLSNGEMKPLIEAPVGTSTGFYDSQVALWSANSQEVVVSSTFLPPNNHAGGNASASSRPWIVSFDLATHAINQVQETVDQGGYQKIRLTGMDWRPGSLDLVLRYANSENPGHITSQEFTYAENRWTRVPDPPSDLPSDSVTATRTFSVSVRESVNQPPVLMASDKGGAKQARLWDPNPQFSSIDFGEASVYTWHDKSGLEWKGGLVKPPDFVAGRRYPLVVQTHGFNPDQFLIDGIYPTAMAARALATRGIVVLQLGKADVKVYGSSTPEEAEAMRDGIVTAIDSLNAEGLIDPARVGIIGFSRWGWYELSALLHNADYFKAATLAECTYVSYGEYLMNADYGGPGRAQSIASGIGPKPFGIGLQKWLSDSAGFNTDKINAPILFEANSPSALIYSWDVYAAMRLQDKPVDMLYFRNGEHALSKPRELEVSQEMNVDWYDFWLNGHEDPDPTKKEQYRRWEHLRELQETEK